MNEAVEIGNVEEYRRIFGDHCTFSYLSHAVHQYFLQGGAVAVVVRLANRATSARIEAPGFGGPLLLAARCPGSREDLRISVDYDGLESDSMRFNLVVQRVCRSACRFIEDQELFLSVSVSADDPRYIGDVLGQSKLVVMAGPVPASRPAATIATHPGQPIPYLDATSAGSDGQELTDYDFIGSNRHGTGLFALDRLSRIDLLCIPPPPSRDLGTTTFVAAERYCERRRAMLIWDPPVAWQSADAALLGIRGTGLTSPNTLTYFPRVAPRADRGEWPVQMPACGVVAGMLAVGDDRGPWLLDGRPRLWTGLTTLAQVAPKQELLLHRFGVNTLTRDGDGDIRLEGDVCLEHGRSLAASRRRLAPRRTMLAILGAVERLVLGIVEGNAASASTDDLGAAVQSFFDELHRCGAFAGQTPTQSYYVRAVNHDEETVSNGEEAGDACLRFGIALIGAGRFESFQVQGGSDGPVIRNVLSFPGAEVLSL